MTPELERRIRRLSQTELLQVSTLVSELLEPECSSAEGEDMSPRQYRARMWENHRPAFELFRRTCSLIEDAIDRSRDCRPALARALDMLFIQAYKSFSSIHLLCVHGHGEDAATILRRLLEIGAQVEYLTVDERAEERERRGAKYLAYFWAQARDIAQASLPSKVKQDWQDMYDQHKHLIRFDDNERPCNWWADSSRDRSISRLFALAGLRRRVYTDDYALLSQMAHATSQGNLIGVHSGRIDIRSDRFVSEMLVANCRYMLSVASRWGEHFGLLEQSLMASLAAEATGFTFDGT